MIGQSKVIEQIDNLVKNGFPRFLVITGQKGQGKTELVKYISNKLNIQMAEIGIKIDDIRELIKLSYKQTEPIIYLIQNANNMSIGAQNSLLKIIEEPPNSVYIIMELLQIENILETIKSRCYEIKMQDYSYQEKMEMINRLGITEHSNEICILNKLDNYWQIKTVYEYDAIDFFKFVENVYDNIYKVQGSNSFKLEEKLDLKDNNNGYNLELFFNMYIQCGLAELQNYALSGTWKDDDDTIEHCLEITSKYIQKLNIKGINKQMLVDNWILDIRKEWSKYYVLK